MTIAFCTLAIGLDGRSITFTARQYFVEALPYLCTMTHNDYMEAILNRHSVRKYTGEELSYDVVSALQAEIENINEESGLHLQLVVQEPRAFSLGLTNYGFFSGVNSYIVLAGKDCKELDELCGYYGEMLVLLAQHMGVNSCWVGLTYKKVANAFSLEEGERLVCVIALGYGKTFGFPHKSKSVSDVVTSSSDRLPAWFESGVKSALLAPTAMNRQSFTFCCDGHKVSIRPGTGRFSNVDLGIAKLHFEVGVGHENFEWV